MAISTAMVESDGWVLRVTLAGAPGSFASYALDPDGAARLQLMTNHVGFVASGGAAVPGVMARALVVTRPLRLPATATGQALNPAVIDETDNGDGTVTVRLALSEHVYASDTGLMLVAAAGWRSGAGATALAVTNGSTLAAPLPIFRWMVPPYTVAAGPFRLSLLVAAQHPVGYLPVAGVRFTITDGVSSRSVWATALSDDDGLRCHSVMIDPAGLNAGLLRCDAEVFPFLGAMRSTDAAGARSMAGLTTAGFRTDAQSPLVVGYDPVGARYSGQFLFVDPAGTATASAAMVQGSHAAAKALPVGERPVNVSTALQALYLANRTLAAANGQAAVTRSADGAQIALAAGVHVIGATGITFGLNSGEIPPVIMGDPDLADRRVQCVLQTAASAPTLRISRLRLMGLRLEIGGASLASSGTVQYLIDDCEVRGRAGFETNPVSPVAATSAVGSWNVAVTRSRWWRTGVPLALTNLRCGLVRATEHSRRAEGLALVGNRFIPASEDTTVTGIFSATGNIGTIAGDAPGCEDIIIAFNDLRGVRSRAWSSTPATAVAAGTPNPSLRRMVVMNNLCERIGADGQPFWSIGEGTSNTVRECIIEGNSFVGERCNGIYADPAPVTLADTDNQRNQALNNRFAGNAFDWWPSKHDDFHSPSTLSVRTAAGVVNPNGFRAQMIEAWSAHFGVGSEGNFVSDRIDPSNFRRDWFGLRSTPAGGAVDPMFTLDASKLGTGAGQGDYRPRAGSPLLGRVRRANSDRDVFGAARAAESAAGAVQPVAAPALAPTGAVHPQRAGAAAVAIGFGLVPQAARQGVRDTSPGLLVSGGAVVLLPGGALTGLGNTPVLLFPSGANNGLRTLRVPVETRTILVQRN